MSVNRNVTVPDGGCTTTSGLYRAPRPQIADWGAKARSKGYGSCQRVPPARILQQPLATGGGVSPDSVVVGIVDNV